MGVRFNAEKKAIGNYFSTKIWSFKMKCPNCPNRIEFHTDPKNAAYVIAAGGKKKTETFDSADAHTMKLLEEETKERLEEDPFFRLEHLAEDKEKVVEQTPWIEELEDQAREKHLDDYGNNRKLRDEFRKQNKVEKRQIEDGAKLGLSLPLLASIPSDDVEASAIVSAHKRHARNQKVVMESIFGKQSGSAATRDLLKASVKRGFDVSLIKKSNDKPKMPAHKLAASNPSTHQRAQLQRSAPPPAPGALPRLQQGEVLEGFNLLGDDE